MTHDRSARNVPLAFDGSVSGRAWIEPAQMGVEMTIVGKLSFELGQDGVVKLLPRPEAPGWNTGLAAHEELDAEQSRRIIVRGERACGGRAVLRRGPDILAEAGFGPGDDLCIVPFASTLQTTVASRRGDEWLVVEGAEGPEVRRWCKLPKLGILATWGAVDRTMLTSRSCLVDVSTWTVSFVLRASRKLLAAMVPQEITISMVELETGLVPRVDSSHSAAPPPPAPAPEPERDPELLSDSPGEPGECDDDDPVTVASDRFLHRVSDPGEISVREFHLAIDDSTTGLHTRPAPGQEMTRMAPSPLSPQDTTKIAAVPKELLDLPPLDPPAPSRPEPPQRRNSSAGFRLGPRPGPRPGSLSGAEPPPRASWPDTPEESGESSFDDAFGALGGDESSRKK